MKKPTNKILTSAELREKEKIAAYNQGYKDGFDGERIYETSDAYLEGHSEGLRQRRRLGLLRDSYPNGCPDPDCPGCHDKRYHW